MAEEEEQEYQLSESQINGKIVLKIKNIAV